MKTSNQYTMFVQWILSCNLDSNLLENSCERLGIFLVGHSEAGHTDFQWLEVRKQIYLITRVLETTLANHKWTDGGVKSDVLTPIQGSSSVMNDYKNMARRLIGTTGGGESKLGRTERRGRDESGGVENEKNEWVGYQ